MEEAVRQGVAFKADTLEELAQKAGFETKGFLSDVKAYNQAVSSGKDPFGKPAEFLKFKVEKGPVLRCACKGCEPFDAGRRACSTTALRHSILN